MVLTLASLALVGPAMGAPPVYDPARADQYQPALQSDSIPADPVARRIWARAIAQEAAIYGTAAVLEYRQLYAQAVEQSDPGFTGFNRFAHGRDLAGPDYRPFKTPNADTLYSNAWLDLRNGPVVLDVPDTAGRYYTASLLDIHGNASNIGARTFGTKGGRYLIATSGWQGEVPPGTTLFRVNTPFTWILLRILVDRPEDLPRARALQDRFHITPIVPVPSLAGFPDGRDESAAGFFRILDFVLQTCGHPADEGALVHGFEGIGLGGSRPFDKAAADPEIGAGLEQGLADARGVIAGAMGQNGQRSGPWTAPVDLGRYGANYLYRAAINTMGTGANVIDENHPFTSFVDDQGQALDGAKAAYELVFAAPPPARFFWSVTVYDRKTRTLAANRWRKYVLGDRTPGLRHSADGQIAIRFSTSAPLKGAQPNWLPVPPGPFYVTIRAQGPGEAIGNGTWRPAPLHRIAPEAAK